MQDRHCTLGGRSRPALQISAATGAGQSKMSVLRAGHPPAVGILDTQPGQKFLCTQTAVQMVYGICSSYNPIAVRRTDSSYAISCLVHSL